MFSIDIVIPQIENQLVLERDAMRRRQSDFLALAFWVALTFSVATFASQFQPGAWYATLAKPVWTPPGWLFGPVWGMLYLAMGVSAWFIWRRRSGKNVRVLLGFYLAQLLVNGLWSWLFFGSQLIGAALVDLLVLVLLLAVTLSLFVRVDKRAGFLLVPYLLWCCFAAALNYQIWRMN